MRGDPTIVIGGGVTGLAAGRRSGAVVLERAEGPGGICRSYHVRPGSTEALAKAPADGDAYRFEVGGGHWLFGGPPDVLRELAQLSELREYGRVAEVRLGDAGITVPYPLQAHVDQLGEDVRHAVAAEMAKQPDGWNPEGATLGASLVHSFGQTLFDLFFGPFHDRYTAGLTHHIAPQDAYKSPAPGNAGYNAVFRYPVGGLDLLTRTIAADCDVRYGSDVVRIDTARCVVGLADGTEMPYGRLLSTLPLDQVLAVANVTIDEAPDPYTSVLVLNIGGERGPACPTSHWQYEPDSYAGFHRIGFYSNVDKDFLPVHRRDTHVSMYVERAYPAGTNLDANDIERYTKAAVDELTERGYITSVDVADPSYVETAYTWRRPGSTWRDRAIDALARVGVTQVGRYARWHFQGIGDSIAEGFAAGAAAR